LLRDWLGITLAAFLFAISFPFLALSWLLDRFGSRGELVFSRNQNRASANASFSPNSWAANEFRFADAIEKYEELIDASVRRRE